MAVVYSKVLLFDPPLIYTAPDTCVFGAVSPPYVCKQPAESVMNDYKPNMCYILIIMN